MASKNSVYSPDRSVQSEYFISKTKSSSMNGTSLTIFSSYLFFYGDSDEMG